MATNTVPNTTYVEPHTALRSFPRRGRTSFFEPDRVRIEDSAGKTLPFPTLVWIRVHEAALEH